MGPLHRWAGERVRAQSCRALKARQGVQILLKMRWQAIEGSVGKCLHFKNKMTTKHCSLAGEVTPHLWVEMEGIDPGPGLNWVGN